MIKELIANQTCSGIWEKNQNVELRFRSDNVKVVSRQCVSTPGIKTKVTLHPNTTYQITVFGSSDGDTKAVVWVYEPSTKKRLVPNYVFLCNKVEATFRTTASTSYYVGVLITSPRDNQSFTLRKIEVCPKTLCHEDSVCDSDDAEVYGCDTIEVPHLTENLSSKLEYLLNRFDNNNCC
jgi:hypothetical protein